MSGSKLGHNKTGSGRRETGGGGGSRTRGGRGNRERQLHNKLLSEEEEEGGSRTRGGRGRTREGLHNKVLSIRCIEHHQDSILFFLCRCSELVDVS